MSDNILQDAGNPAIAPAAPETDSPGNNNPELENGQTPGSAPADEYLTAPQSYKKEYADKFSTLPADYRKYLHEREKEYQQGVSQYRNRVKWLDDEFAKRKGQLDGFNSPQEYLQTLMSFADSLNANPRDTLIALAQAYNIGGENNNAGEISPAVEARLNALQDKLTKQQAYLDARQRVEADKAYTAFANAKDDAGNLKYQYLEDVRQAMSDMFKNGSVSTLEEAYERAIWTNPEIRAKLIEAKTQSALSNKVSAAKQAKELGFSPTSKASPEATEMSTRELLEKQFKEAGYL